MENDKFANVNTEYLLPNAMDIIMQNVEQDIDIDLNLEFEK